MTVALTELIAATADWSVADPNGATGFSGVIDGVPAWEALTGLAGKFDWEALTGTTTVEPVAGLNVVTVLF
jgi:hypothetical protein